MSRIAKPQNERRLAKIRPSQIPIRMTVARRTARTVTLMIRSGIFRVGQLKTSLGWSVILNKLRLFLRSSLRTTDISYPKISSGCRLALLHRILGATLLWAHNTIGGTKVTLVSWKPTSRHVRRCNTTIAGASRPSTGSSRKRCSGKSLLHRLSIIANALILACHHGGQERTHRVS
jgi:hypothetical protein